ncbi:MAG: aryl-sulfate sulfotransferase [Planctomycetota bacterium]
MEEGTPKVLRALFVMILVGSGSLCAQPTSGKAAKQPRAMDFPPTIVNGPSISQNPNPLVPLAAVVRLETDEPTTVQLEIDSGSHQWTVPPEEPSRRVHEIPVIGLRASKTYQVVVTVIDRQGNRVTAPEILQYTSPDLPADFPPLEIRKSVPAFMEPGQIAFAVTYGTDEGESGSWRIILSAEGDVLWYHRDLTRGGNLERLRNGNLLLALGGRELIAEIDPLGNVVGSWASNMFPGDKSGSVVVDTDTFHHEMLQLPEGRDADFLVLSSEARIYQNYPADEVDTSITSPTAKVIGDVIVEYRRDGTIVRQTSLLDVFDPYRICYDALNGGYWDGFYTDDQYSHVHDWTHANSVILDPRDGNYIVSMRHQEAVAKIVPGATSPDGVVWILGPPGRWVEPWKSKLLRPTGPGLFAWQFHQHAPEINATGNLVMFDNGNYRAVPPTVPLPPKDWYSRAVEYQIDEQNLGIQQVWAYGGRLDIPQNEFFAGFLGDADPMPITGNVLVTDGGKVSPAGRNYARIAEVSHTSPAVVVFEVIIRDRTETSDWLVYRAEKFGQ